VLFYKTKELLRRCVLFRMQAMLWTPSGIRGLSIQPANPWIGVIEHERTQA